MPARPDRLAAPGPLSTADRARLVAEIVSTRRAIRRAQAQTDDVREVLATIRDRRLAADVVPGPGAVATRLANAVQRVTPRLPGDSRCLAQSLLLCAMLAPRGLNGTLVIGIDAEEQFGAHAWVELGGSALLPQGGFGRLTEL